MNPSSIARRLVLGERLNDLRRQITRHRADEPANFDGRDEMYAEFHALRDELDGIAAPLSCLGLAA